MGTAENMFEIRSMCYSNARYTSTHVGHMLDIRSTCYSFFWHLRSDILEPMRNVKLRTTLCWTYIQCTYSVSQCMPNIFQIRVHTPNVFSVHTTFFSDNALSTVWEAIAAYPYRIWLYLAYQNVCQRQRCIGIRSQIFAQCDRPISIS